MVGISIGREFAGFYAFPIRRSLSTTIPFTWTAMVFSDFYATSASWSRTRRPLIPLMEKPRKNDKLEGQRLKS